MFKSTYSFYRYLTVTCEKCFHFSAIHKTRSVDLKFKRPFSCHTVLQKKQKRKIPIRIIKMQNEDTIEIETSSDDTLILTPYQDTQKTTPKTKLTPEFREWEGLCYSGLDFPPRFKIVSYNILAQHLLEGHPHLYYKCSPNHLEWNNRCIVLIKEITDMNADILCLQEVQADHLKQLDSIFQKLGYAYVYKQKTGAGKDGCAIFYKTDTFGLVDSLSVEFNQPKLPLLNRDNVALLVKLVHNEKPDVPIVVATTHLLYNPGRVDVKLAQMQLLLAEIDRFSFVMTDGSPGHLPIILTGDFNSTPDSKVIQLLTKGRVSAEGLRGSGDWEKIGVTDNCQHLSVYLNRRAGQATVFGDLKIYHSSLSTEKPEPASQTEKYQKTAYSPLFNTSDIFQTLRLVSAYDRKFDLNRKVTSYQDGWVRVDYIFYSNRNYLRLVQRLRLPTGKQCGNVSLPNETFGSDHLAVGAVFEITSQAQTGPWP